MYMPKQWIINNLFTKTLIDKLSKIAKKPFDSQFVNIKCDAIDTILELGDLETSYTNGRSLKEDILSGLPISGMLYCQTDVYYLTSTETDEGEDYAHVYLIYKSNNKSIKVTVNGYNEETFDVTRIEYVPDDSAKYFNARCYEISDAPYISFSDVDSNIVSGRELATMREDGEFITGTLFYQYSTAIIVYTLVKYFYDEDLKQVTMRFATGDKSLDTRQRIVEMNLSADTLSGFEVNEVFFNG